MACGPGCTFDTSGCYASRFEDRGLTVYDNQTGLEWEKKTDDNSIHDKDNAYTWTDGGDGDFTDPDGTAYTNFLATLNDCESDNGVTISGGFDDHCDWRLPGIDELKTIVDCGFSPCIDPVFGPTAASFYWSSTSIASGPTLAWFVDFLNGIVLLDSKPFDYHVRAVRGGLN